MKKIIAALLFLLIIATPSYSFASSTTAIETKTVEKAKNGYYYETVVKTNVTTANTTKAATKTQTGTKTTYYKNSAGKTMWYVRVSGTFTYGNGTSKCTQSSMTAASNNNNWKIASKSASKSGNKATAKATAKRYQNGVALETQNRSVTLTCSSTGKLS